MVVRPNVTNFILRPCRICVNLCDRFQKQPLLRAGLAVGTIPGETAVPTRRLHINLNRALLLLPIAFWLLTNGAVAAVTACAAGSVCYYVAVQPIDVCSGTGTGCAP